jgi:hypothetical protein
VSVYKARFINYRCGPQSFSVCMTEELYHETKSVKFLYVPSVIRYVYAMSTSS